MSSERPSTPSTRGGTISRPIAEDRRPDAEVDEDDRQPAGTPARSRRSTGGATASAKKSGDQRAGRSRRGSGRRSRGRRRPAPRPARPSRRRPPRPAQPAAAGPVVGLWAPRSAVAPPRAARSIPPITKPATAAPVISCSRCSAIWRRQSVSSVTRVRRAPTEARELGLLEVDVAADLLGRAARGAGTGSARAAGPVGWAAAHVTLPRVSLVSLASSIAIAGFGGEPFWTSL